MARLNNVLIVYWLCLVCGIAGSAFSKEDGGPQSDSLPYSGKIIAVQRNHIDCTHVYTYHQEGLRPGGGLWLCDFSGGATNLSLILDSREGIILDACLDYEGKVILFSWKKRMTDKFQLYSVRVDGSGLKRIFDHDSNNFNASWLPDGGIVFLSDRRPAFAYCWQTTTPILWRCQADGGRQIRLSANYLNDFTPSVFSDGRIVYSRWEYVDRPAIPIQGMWSINPDGTGLAGVFGNRVLSPATFMDAREIPDGTGRILCVMTSHNGPCCGAIGIVDPRKGANAQEAIVNLTPEINIGQVDKGDGNSMRGPYQNPFPLDDRYYLVSRGGEIQLRDYAGTVNRVLLAKQNMGFFNPLPVRARPREKLISSSLSPGVSLDGKDGAEWATIMMRDVYVGLEGYVERGTVKRLAVVQEMEKPIGIDPNKRAFGFQFPVVSAGATYAPKKVWGYATVEPDGSANFKVPAGLPIYFLPLDASGRAVQRMRTFTHLMPGETQGCIGCHPNRNSLTPQMSTKRPLAMSRPAEELTKPEWGVAGFGYSRIVQPVLDKHCISCHGWEGKAGGLELSGDKTDFFNVSYEYLVRKGTGSERHAGGGTSRYTAWISSYNGQESNILEIKPGRWGAKASLLGSVVESGHPDKAGKPRISMTAAEKHKLYMWMDLNCPYYQTSDSAHRENRGCRQILPQDFEGAFRKISDRRCATCHKGTVWDLPGPMSFAVRLDHPERNGFLDAPLAKSAGGSGKCSQPVFAGKDDPDYQSMLKLFDQVQAMLAAKPRMDMVDTRPEGNPPECKR